MCLPLRSTPHTRCCMGRWPWRPGIGNSPVSATPRSQSFEKSLLKPHRAAHLPQLRLARAECPGMQMTQQAHRDALLLALTSFVSCYSGWQLKRADETEPVGTDGLCGCEERCCWGYGEGCGRDELFSEHHTRGCQIAFLRAAAFPRTRLDKIWLCTSRWLLPPL